MSHICVQMSFILRKFIKSKFILLLINVAVFCIVIYKVFIPNGLIEDHHKKIQSILQSYKQIDCSSPVYQQMVPASNESTSEKVEEEFTLKHIVGSSCGKYLWHPFYWTSSSSAASNMSKYKVCLATQTSLDGMNWLVEQAKVWNGPISAAVYVQGSDLELAEAMIRHMKKCFSYTLSNLVIHLAYPVKMRGYRTNRNISLQEISCSNSPHYVLKQLVLKSKEYVPENDLYPQNFLRNVARKGCITPYILTVDVDMISVPKMSESLELFFNYQNCSKCAYIVPVYEIHKDINYVPENKNNLLNLIKKNKARVFHIKKYAKNQGNSHLKEWEKYPNITKDKNGVPKYKIMYPISTYEEAWEPIMILSRTAPGFNERFVGYGYTRSSHVFELYSRQYKFKVLDQAFLSHRGFQNYKFIPWRSKQVYKNKYRYRQFKKGLIAELTQ